MMVSSSSGDMANWPSEVGGFEQSPTSVSVPADDPGRLADGKGHIGVDGGYIGVIGALASRGSTKAFQGP
jgi:hypothetical protein